MGKTASELQPAKALVFQWGRSPVFCRYSITIKAEEVKEMNARYALEHKILPDLLHSDRGKAFLMTLVQKKEALALCLCCAAGRRTALT